MSSHRRIIAIITFFVVVLGMIGCSGDNDPVTNQFVGAGGEPPTTVGTINGETGGAISNPGFQPIVGQLKSAPLGTNPEYNVQDAESVIQTYRVAGTSSVSRAPSQDPNQVLWVSVVPHGADPIPSGSGGPFEEGTKVDLYIRYNVLPGELMLTRTWFIHACGLNFSDTYTHPEAGTYETVLPFIIPYGSSVFEAVFTGIVGLPKQVSVYTLSDYVGYGEVPFEIIYVPVFPPDYYPQDYPLDNEGPHPCMPDWGSISVYPDLHVESTDKGVGAVVYIFDETPNELNGDEVAVKYSGFSGKTYDPTKEKGQGNPFPPINPATGEPFEISQCTVVFVSSGCNSSGYGPGYGWRFDAPFGDADDPETNQIPTAQIVVEETEPNPDLNIVPDYDYNDFAGTFRAVEMYKDPPGVSNNNGLLVQIELTVYAQACSVDEPNQWQLNVDCDMPLGTEVQAIVQLFNNDKEPKPYSSDQIIYFSDSGFSVPVFKPLDQSLVYPKTAEGADYASVNCDPWNYPQFVEGDYAVITITLNEPAGTGGYDPWPYVPVMWIGLPNVGAKSISFWKEIGDELNADGMPQAMLLPDTFAWPLEAIPIWDVYDGFNTWIEYLNNPTMYPPLYHWYDEFPYTGENPDTDSAPDPTTWKAFSRDKFTPWPE